MIKEFSGKNRYLSNFWPALVLFEGMFYPTVENAYQAAKKRNYKEVFLNCSPGKAKRLGSEIEKCFNSKESEWWKNRKISVMGQLIKQKFRDPSFLAEKLAATEGEIIEGNRHGDSFWGVFEGTGLNYLGILLMERRAELLEST